MLPEPKHLGSTIRTSIGLATFDQTEAFVVRGDLTGLPDVPLAKAAVGTDVDFELTTGFGAPDARLDHG